MPEPTNHHNALNAALRQISGDQVEPAAPGSIRDQLAGAFDDTELLFLDGDGFDSAIVGVAKRCGEPMIVVYDRGRLLDALMAMGMDDDEAREYLSVNIEESHVGPETPAVLTPLEYLGIGGPHVYAQCDRRHDGDACEDPDCHRRRRPMFANGVAQGKWDSLQAEGYRMQRIEFARHQGGTEKLGSIDPWGKVRWHGTGAPGDTDAQRAAWLADKIGAMGDYAQEAAAMLRRWPGSAT
jgi:hypothetical protein